MSLALTLAKPAPVHAVTGFTYDPTQQLNITPDGVPAVRAKGLDVLLGSATTSTAGSKTHNDDTD